MKLIFAIFSVLIFFFSQVDSQSQPNHGRVQIEGDWYTDYKGVVKIINSTYDDSCVGVLIHSEWILTSAVCAFKTFRQEMRILYGGDYYNFDSAAHIKNTYIHPEFSGEIRENDIALLELAKAADASVRIFKIPRVKRSLVAKKARVVKWSYYNKDWNENPTSGSQNLNDYINTSTGAYSRENGYSYYSQVVILNNDLCANYAVHVSENRLCTYESIACEGDEGAPLVTCGDNELVGLISVSEVQAAICYYYNNCMMPVTTYTSVLPYRDWIKSVTEINIL